MKNMKIGGRLNAGFAVVLILAVAISLLASWQLRNLAYQNRTLLETPLQRERLISSWHGKIDSAIRRTSAIAKSSDNSLAAFFQAESGVPNTAAEIAPCRSFDFS